MNKFKELVKKLTKTGFFSIYLATICSKVVTLIGGVLIVRLLTQEDYSIYTLAINAISMLTIFGDFGMSNALLQYAIEKEKNVEEQNSFFILAIKMTIISSALSTLLILISPIFYPYQNEQIRMLTITMCCLPFFTSMINYFSTILRVKKKNNKYSLYQVLTAVIHYSIVIIFTLIFGLKGALLSQYIYNIILVIIGLLFIRKFSILKSKEKISSKDKKGFFHIAFGSQISMTLNSVLYTIDIFILGIMIVNSTEISLYKVSTIIPTALSFLPQCLSIYIFPYFISHCKEKDWIKRNVKKVIIYSAPVYGAISVLAILLSKVIMYLLYGEDYLASSIPFIFLMIGFFFTATFKLFLGNVIYSFHKIGFSVALNVILVLINVILDILFINLFGYVGVAISTMTINIIASIISIIYYRYCMKKLFCGEKDEKIVS